VHPVKKIESNSIEYETMEATNNMEATSNTVGKQHLSLPVVSIDHVELTFCHSEAVAIESTQGECEGDNKIFDLSQTKQLGIDVELQEINDLLPMESTGSSMTALITVDTVQETSVQDVRSMSKDELLVYIERLNDDLLLEKAINQNVVKELKEKEELNENTLLEIENVKVEVKLERNVFLGREKHLQEELVNKGKDITLLHDQLLKEKNEANVTINSLQSDLANSKAKVRGIDKDLKLLNLDLIEKEEDITILKDGFLKVSAAEEELTEILTGKRSLFRRAVNAARKSRAIQVLKGSHDVIMAMRSMLRA